MKLKRVLSLFDATNIVIGSAVGADIYIVSAITAGLVGPLSIILWVLAGLAAMSLALIFAYSSYYVPKVGGSFAFVSTAFDKFYGFLAGWSMWIAELLALPVYTIVFTNYLQYFLPLNFFYQTMVKGLFLFALTFVNIVGVKAAGWLNDFLTLAKLSPLLLIVVVGLISFLHNPTLLSNYSPLAPLGLQNIGTAFILIFWAYAGFELGTLPASEVKNPKKTIPKAIIFGMSIVTLFYISINFVVYGTMNWQQLKNFPLPLVAVGATLLGAVGAIIMTLGALISVSGTDESGVLSIARLSYAMSLDGLFPKIFSKVTQKYRTPYASLIIQGVIAFLLSIFSTVAGLISFSVFNLSFAFLLTCLALIILKRGREKELIGQNVLPWIGVAICLYLLYSTGIFDKIIGALVILAGIPIYIFFSPKREVKNLKRLFVSEEMLMARKLERKERFLANFVRLIHKLYKKL